MNEQTKGVSVVITSLRGDENVILERVFPKEKSAFSLPYSGNFQLWQAFHTDLKSRKNPDAAMAYVKRKSAWLAAKYDAISKEKKTGICA